MSLLRLIALRNCSALILTAVLLTSVSAWALSPDTVGKLEKVVKSYGVPQTGISVLSLDDGDEFFGSQATRSLKPASVMKLVVSAVALRRLGPDYRFETKVMVPSNSRLSSGKVDKLYVVGGGDPVLTTEDVWIIARTIKRRGIREIGSISLDSFAFMIPQKRQGQKAYEAGSSALSLNFNSLFFEICPTVPGRPASVAVDPWEMPIKVVGSIVTNGSRSGTYQVDELPVGKPPDHLSRYRVKGKIGANRDCGHVYRSVKDPVSYFGHVLKETLGLLGVSVQSQEFLREPAHKGDRKLFSYKSKSLSKILEDLNHYSTNFIAEQILTSLDGAPRDKSRDVGLGLMRGYLEGLGVGAEGIELSDGSGLSHDNRLSAQLLSKLLVKLYKDPKVGPEFVKSLSVAGRNGTLEDRRIGEKGVVIRAKTGTLRNVTALAGYIFTRSEKAYAFAILQNGVRSKDKALRLERELLSILGRS